MKKVKNSDLSKKKKIEFEVARSENDGIGHLPRQLDSLRRLFSILNDEKNTDSINSLFHLYIYSLCSFCEGLLRTTYKEVINKDWNNIIDGQHINLIEQATFKLHGYSWENLKNEDITYLGESLPSAMKEGDTFKTLNILFKLRNLLVHGNSFEVSLLQDYPSEEYRYEIAGKAKDVYSFLIQKKLIDQASITHALKHYELNSKIVAYFICKVIEFTKSYSEFLKKVTDYDYLEYFTILGLFDEKYRVLE